MSFIVVMVWWFELLIQLTYTQDFDEVVVIDINAGSVTSGFMGDDAPRSVIELADSFDITQILGQVFYNQLLVDSEYTAVFMTVDIDTDTVEYRETLKEILFVTYNVPQVYLAKDPPFALFSYGLTTGLVVLIEEQHTVYVPVYQQEMVTDAIAIIDIGMRDLVHFMAEQLSQIGYNVSVETARDIVDKLAYVALDFEEEISDSVDRLYQLPDGTIITIGNDRFRIPEALFNPAWLGLPVNGITDAIFTAIMATDVSMREDLFNNIVLAGSGSLFDGIEARLFRELSALMPPGESFVIQPSTEREFAVWRGASVYASFFDVPWINREEYCDTYGNCGSFPPPVPSSISTSTTTSSIIQTTEKQSEEDSDEDSSDEPIMEESSSGDSNSDSSEEQMQHSSFMNQVFELVSGAKKGESVDNDVQMLVLSIWGLIAIILLCNVTFCCFCYCERKKAMNQSMNILCELEEGHTAPQRHIDL